MKFLPLLLLAAVVSSAATTSSVTISDLSGSAQNSRPFTISRLFAQGEISGFPQPVVSGSPASLWQADVKTRWPDGSVQHALISFKATMAAGSSVTVSFANSANPCSSGSQSACDGAGLTAQQMLNFDTGSGAGSWGAKIEATASGSKQAADARAILAAGSVSYWLRGPVVTQAILEDRSPAMAFDFGWQCTSNCSGDYSTATWTPASSSSFTSLHPIFIATFYPGYSGVKIDYILENTWSNKLQDQRYSFTLYAGNSSPATVFSQASTVPHWGRTRWRKTFWSGSTPGAVKVDYNLPYLIYSKAIPSFDLGKSVTSTGINAETSTWQATDKGAIMGDWLEGTNHKSGQWYKYMPNTGGREEIGLFPTWVVRYLYTFNTAANGNSLYDVMIGNAEVGGYVPVHVREGGSNGTQAFCGLSQACSTSGLSSTPAFGHTLSKDVYPKGPNLTYAAPLSSSHNWTVDNAHQGSFAYIPYLITGDYYFLEELYFWSGNNIVGYPAGTTLMYMTHDDWAYIRDQIRGNAWSWRTLGETAFMAPDGSPEKAYFRQKLLNNIAIREGQHDIRDGYGYANDNVKWTWGYTRASANQGNTEQTTHIPNPLHIPDFDSNATKDGSDPNVTKYVNSQWQINFWCIVLGHLTELGFPTNKFQEALAKNAINQVVNPALNPWLIGGYRIPAISAVTNTWFQTWQELLTGYNTTEQTRTFWAGGDNNPDGGYPFIARAAASFQTNMSDGIYTGSAAWAWFQTTVNDQYMNENPKWAIVPRSGAAAPPPPPPPTVSPCDLNADGVTDLKDVQLSIDQVLGKSACTGDLNNDGKCTIVDMQRIINAALGGSCRVGP